MSLLLAFRFPIVRRETQYKLEPTIKIMTLGIFAVSIVMGFISITMVGSICPMCSAAYALSLVMFITSWLYFEKGLIFSGLEFKILPAVLIGVFAFGFFIHSNSIRKFGGKEVLEFTQLRYDEWQNYPAKTFTLASPLVLNPSPTAKIKMVEFADFLCGHCASAYSIIHTFTKSHPDVEFSFQAFPLDGECNPAIPHTEGTRCLLARVSQCAGQQDKAWETQEWIFKNQRQLMSKNAVMTKIQEKAESLGLNIENLMECVESNETREAITAQAKLGTDIGIRGTPALYINGKRVPSGFTIPLLEKIYSDLKKSAK